MINNAFADIWLHFLVKSFDDFHSLLDTSPMLESSFLLVFALIFVKILHLYMTIWAFGNSKIVISFFVPTCHFYEPLEFLPLV